MCKSKPLCWGFASSSSSSYCLLLPLSVRWHVGKLVLSRLHRLLAACSLSVLPLAPTPLSLSLSLPLLSIFPAVLATLMGIRSKFRKLICCSQHTNAIIFNVILQVSLSLGNCLVQSSWCSACGRFTCSLQKKSKKFVMRIDNDLLFKAQTNIRQFKRQTRENKHKTRTKDPKFVFRVLVVYLWWGTQNHKQLIGT